MDSYSQPSQNQSQSAKKDFSLAETLILEEDWNPLEDQAPCNFPTPTSLVDSDPAVTQHPIAKLPTPPAADNPFWMPNPFENESFLTKNLSHPIGQRLEAAGLLSSGQIEVTLRDQQHGTNLLFGEILLLRSWIQEQTLAFFLNLDKASSTAFQQLPLGQRLKTAGLVTDWDIERALADQRRARIKLGQVLVSQGVISQQTADFFASL